LDKIRAVPEFKQGQHGYDVSISFKDFLLCRRFFNGNNLRAIICATFKANMMGDMQGITLRARHHSWHVEAQIMRPPAVAPNSGNFAFW
jgi:hypothetical protein